MKEFPICSPSGSVTTRLGPRAPWHFLCRRLRTKVDSVLIWSALQPNCWTARMCKPRSYVQTWRLEVFQFGAIPVTRRYFNNIKCKSGGIPKSLGFVQVIHLVKSPWKNFKREENRPNKFQLAKLLLQSFWRAAKLHRPPYDCFRGFICLLIWKTSSKFDKTELQVNSSPWNLSAFMSSLEWTHLASHLPCAKSWTLSHPAAMEDYKRGNRWRNLAITKQPFQALWLWLFVAPAMPKCHFFTLVCINQQQCSQRFSVY